MKKKKNVNQQTSCPTSLEDASTLRHLRWPNVGPQRSCSSGAEDYNSSLSTCSTFSSVPPAVSAAVSFIWASISAVRASSRRLLTLRTRSSCFLKGKHKEEKHEPLAMKECTPLQWNEVHFISSFEWAAARWMVNITRLVFTEASVLSASTTSCAKSQLASDVQSAKLYWVSLLNYMSVWLTSAVNDAFGPVFLEMLLKRQRNN